MKFAKVGEEALERHAELKKGAELRLYVIILFHTWNDSRICNRSLRELCEIYGLNYDHYTSHLKSLRKKGWVENTKKYIRPLVGFKSMAEKTSKSAVSKLPNRKSETSKSEVGNFQIGSYETSKTSKSAVSSIPYIEPLKIEPLEHTTQGKNVVSVSSKNSFQTNGGKSGFSLAECLRYVEAINTAGANIYNPHGLAMSIFKSGESDALIAATLYPSTSEIETKPEDDEARRTCPRCFGNGMEFVYEDDGTFKGCRPNCRHEPLRTGEWLFVWKANQETFDE